MRITEDVRKYAAEQGITEEAAIKKGLEQKATESPPRCVEAFPRPGSTRDSRVGDGALAIANFL